MDSSSNLYNSEVQQRPIAEVDFHKNNSEN